MIIGILSSKQILRAAVIVLAAAAVLAGGIFVFLNDPVAAISEGESFIKYVEFNPTYEALEKALGIDIASYNGKINISWIDLLAFLGTKYGGDFSKYKAKDMDNIAARLKNGENIEDITADMKYFPYYREAYSAVLCELVGEYETENPDKPGEKIMKYGLKAYSPIAKGFPMSHYDDFGSSRSYGYKRRHLGHDMMGSVGTPIIAVEGGIVEALGWNQYGGWRIGIRSFDGLRYYYYAHLRKDRPYHVDLELGKTINAGDVIGYLGRTGYSRTENVNNIKTPHLHIGLQLIFDESQKEGPTEIWVDMYALTKLLSKKQSAAIRDPETKEYYAKTQPMPEGLT